MESRKSHVPVTTNQICIANAEFKQQKNKKIFQTTNQILSQVTWAHQGDPLPQQALRSTRAAEQVAAASAEMSSDSCDMT